MRIVLCAVCLCLLSFSASAFDWPSFEEPVTEFAASGSALYPEGFPAYMAFASRGDFSPSGTGEVIFRGLLPNGLGMSEMTAEYNGIRFVYANLSRTSASSDGENRRIATENIDGQGVLRKPLIFFAIDSLRHRIINPEILFSAPPGNQAPSLRRLRFSSVLDGGVLGETIDLWSWVRRSRIASGQYLVNLDWADGRFSWNDVDNIFSLRVYANGQLILRQGLEYFAENGEELSLIPGRSDNGDRLQISLRPGMNIIEVYLSDPKGLSQSYEFTIDGGPPGPE